MSGQIWLVKEPAVQVSIEGRIHIVEAGSPIPPATDDATIGRLHALGMIEPFTLVEPTEVIVEEPAETDPTIAGDIVAPPVVAPEVLDEYTVDQLRTYAKERGIDLGTATIKADIRAAIDAAIPAE